MLLKITFFLKNIFYGIISLNIRTVTTIINVFKLFSKSKIMFQ